MGNISFNKGYLRPFTLLMVLVFALGLGYWSLCFFIPLAKGARAIYFSKGFELHVSHLHQYYLLARTKGAIELLAVLNTYKDFQFHDEEIPKYIYLVSEVDLNVLRGLSFMIDSPDSLFSEPGTKILQEFRDLKDPVKLFSSLKKAGFRPLKERLVYLEAYFLVPFSKERSAVDWVKDRSTLERWLEDRLDLRKHTFRKETPYTEGPKGIGRLNYIQLLKTYWLLKALERDEFRRQIAWELSLDVKDPFSEHGGLIILDEGGDLALKVYPSLDQGNNRSYRLALEVMEGKRFCAFHMHAGSKDEGIFAGPSDIMGGDLEAPLLHAERGLPYMGMLITKLAGEAFNVDIYFSNEKDPMDPIVIDLGNYEG